MSDYNSWNPLAAPDLSTALQGLRGAGASFGQAGQAASDALGAYQRSQQDIAGRILAQRVAGIQDPNDLRTALSNGSIYDGLGSANLTSGAIKSAGDQVGTLIQNATNQESLNYNRQMDPLRVQQTQLDLNVGNRDFSQRQAQDAQSQLVGKYIEAVHQGNTDLANQLRGKIDFTNTGARFADTLNTDSMNATSAGKAGYEWGVERTDRDAKFQAEQLGTDLFHGGNGTVQGIDIQLQDPKYASLPAQVKWQARQNAVGLLTGGAGPGPGGAPGYGGGGGQGGGPGGGAPEAGGPPPGGSSGPGQGGLDPSGYDAYAGDWMAAKAPTAPSKRITDMTGAEALNWAKSSLIPATMNSAQLGLAGTGKGTSAIGRYQILATQLPALMAKLGMDPNTTVMTPAVQDRLGEEIFNEMKGGDLSQTWTSLKALPKIPSLGIANTAAPGAFKNLSWNQVKDVIAHGESGNGTGSANINPMELNTRSQSADRALQRAIGGSLAGTTAADWQSAFADAGLDSKTVAQKAVAGDWKAKGVDAGNLQDILDRVVAMGATSKMPVPPSVALAIAKGATRSKSPWERAVSGVDNNDVGNGQEFDESKAKQLVAAYAHGDIQRSLDSVSALNQSHVPVSVTQQTYADAVKDYNTNLAAYHANPEGFNMTLLYRSERALANATRQYSQAVNSQITNTPQEAFGGDQDANGTPYGSPKLHINRALPTQKMDVNTAIQYALRNHMALRDVNTSWDPSRPPPAQPGS